MISYLISVRAPDFKLCEDSTRNGDLAPRPQWTLGNIRRHIWLWQVRGPWGGHGGDCHYLRGGASNAAKQLTMHKTASYQKKYLVPKR